MSPSCDGLVKLGGTYGVQSIHTSHGLGNCHGHFVLGADQSEAQKVRANGRQDPDSPLRTKHFTDIYGSLFGVMWSHCRAWQWEGRAVPMLVLGGLSTSQEHEQHLRCAQTVI